MSQMVCVLNYPSGDLSSSVCELELLGCLAIKVIWEREMKVSYRVEYEMQLKNNVTCIGSYSIWQACTFKWTGFQSHLIVTFVGTWLQIKYHVMYFQCDNFKSLLSHLCSHLVFAYIIKNYITFTFAPRLLYQVLINRTIHDICLMFNLSNK